MKVKTSFRVRYAETDMMGVVYHANYLLYMEDARTDFLEKVGAPYREVEESGYMCPVCSLELSYGQPLRYGEEAFIVTYISNVRPAKITYQQEVYRADMVPGQDKPLVKGKVVACMVRRDGFVPVTFKREFPEKYARFQEIMETEQ